MRPLIAVHVALLGVSLGTLARAAPAGRSASPVRPNIVLFVADDWSYPHAGAYGDPLVRTPHFDRVAREGVLFAHAFAAAPSCTPSRAAMLSGLYPHQLQEGANLWGSLPSRFKLYPDLLEEAGYVVGHVRKAWGPGNHQAGGRTRNPAGPTFRSFAEFMASVPEGKPFALWAGSSNPHRPYDEGAGVQARKDPRRVKVPPYWLDRPQVRADVLDYYTEVEAFDREVGEILAELEKRNVLDRTLVVITSDNGMPFPRAKANLYDAGTRVPLAVRWPGRARRGLAQNAFVNLLDLAPTFLEAAGLTPPPEMTGRSLLPLLAGRRQPEREQVFLERERHANVRKGDLGYPMRAIRTARFLYVWNPRPDRWPAGDPEMWKAVGPYGDCDGSPTKDVVIGHKDSGPDARAFALSFGKRPEEELYDLRKDPHQIDNVAQKPSYAATRRQLRAALDRWMRETGDPRVDPADDSFDRHPYYGPPAQKAAPAGAN